MDFQKLKADCRARRLERLFSKRKLNCREISIDDFYIILLGHGAIEERPDVDRHGSQKTPIDSHEFEKLKKKYKENIECTEYTWGNRNLEEVVTHRNVLVKNLCIFMPAGGSQLPKKINLNVYANEKLIPTNLIFDNVLFSLSPTHISFWDFEKSETSSLRFLNCFFRGIIFRIHQKIQPHMRRIKRTRLPLLTIFFSQDDRSFEYSIHLKDTIVAPGGFALSATIDDSLYNVASAAESREGLCFNKILIENCSLQVARLLGMNLTLRGRNVIEEFEYYSPSEIFLFQDNRWEKSSIAEIAKSIPPQIHWGAYQKIMPSLQHNYGWDKHKARFIDFKKQAEGQRDSSQIATLRREILICDHALIRQEPWLSSWQDRLTLWFNGFFTNYGISWVRPIVLLFSLNFVIVLGLYFIFDKGLDFWVMATIFTETFNPFSNLSAIDMPILTDSQRLIISSLNVLQKVFFAICVYEIIRAGRRFTRQ